MDNKEPKPEKSDIPQKIFDLLISELRNTEVPEPVIGQLEKVIIIESNFTETALRNAMSLSVEI